MRNCNYKKEKDFLKEIAEYFQMGPEATRTSLVVYSEDATLIKRFNANGTLEEFKEIVDKLELQGGRAYIDKAMHMAASTVFTEESGMRDYGVPKVLVILNDGAQTGVTESAKEIASMLQKSEVRVVVIGVGEADEKQLHQIVSKDGDLIMAETFEKAKKKVAALLKQFCPPHGML